MDILLAVVLAVGCSIAFVLVGTGLGKAIDHSTDPNDTGLSRTVWLLVAVWLTPPLVASFAGSLIGLVWTGVGIWEVFQ